MVQPMPAVYPEIWAGFDETAATVTMVLVWASVTVCLLRGAPVVIEFVAREKPAG